VLANALESEKIKPLVEKKYTIDEALEAIQHVEGGRTKGKVVVTITSSEHKKKKTKKAKKSKEKREN